MRMVLEIGCLDGVTFADKGNLAARSRSWQRFETIPGPRCSATFPNHASPLSLSQISILTPR